MKRRDFLKVALAGAAGLAVPALPLRPAFAGQSGGQAPLGIVRRTIEVNGKAASVFGLRRADGAPGLRLRAGDAFNVLLRNETAEPTIIHWHGLTPPWPNDGVADAPLSLIAAGTDRAYDFPVGKPGTHWMHAHTLQEQALLAAPLIVYNPDDKRDEQEIVILLHDFSFSSPEELLAGLKGKNAGGTMPMGQGGMDMSGGAGNTMAGMDDGGMATDINDIDYDAYLANDRTLDDPEVVSMEAGGRARLRIINGATATAFTIDLGELEGELIAVDGQDIEPVKDRRFPRTMGQRIDVRVQLPRESRSFPILALREGSRERTGIVLRPAGATVTKLATTADVDAPVLDLMLEAQLRAIEPLASRPADKTFDMALTGDMVAYRWGLQTNPPLVVDPGDRVEVMLRNTSMMAHPMHLHGHHFQVVAIDGRRLPGAVRDTVLLPPNRSVTIAVDAVNPGQWAFHCHHLYHMATGMMSTFAYRA